MFIAQRPAKCSRLRRSRAGQLLFSHRHTTSSASRCNGLWHTGHVVGITHGGWRSAPSAITGPTTRGITSPAFSTITRSPSRMSLRARSSALCSVAIDTVDPATTTGSRTAYGVAAPVRPTLTWIALSRVVTRSAENLNAIAQRGNLLVEPSVPRSASRSTLITTPSISNGRSCRRPAQVSQNAHTASMPSHACQCGSTGRPQPASSRSRSACVAGEWRAVADHAVDPGPQAAAGDVRRVEVAHRAGGGVARVGVERQPGLGALAVGALERRHRQVGFAAHLDALRRAVVQGQRQRPDGAHVGGHVLAAAAVAAGGAADQPAVVVGERQAQAVDLQFGHVADRPGHVEPLAHALVEGQQFVAGEGVVEALHRRGVRDRVEAFGRAAADPLRRRVGRDEVRMRGLERDQLAHQRVELGVGDLGGVADEVELLVAADLAPELVDALGGRGRHDERLLTLGTGDQGSGTTITGDRQRSRETT